MKIIVRERGSVEVSGSSLGGIFSDPTFYDLTERSILWAKAQRRNSWQLTAGNYIGHALFGDLEIEVREKIPGAFANMVRILTPTAFNLAKAQSPAVFDEAPHSILIQMFVAATRSYLSGAKLVEYSATAESGAYAAGRLDIPRTAALRARGIRHKVAFRRSRLSDDLPLNRAIYLALGDVMTGFGMTVSQDLIASARTLRAGFSECRDRAFESQRFLAIKSSLNEAARRDYRPQVIEVAALTAAVLQAATLSSGRPRDGSIPSSWFLNLENLFEKVVRECTSAILVGKAQVTGPVNRPPLFQSIPEHYRANPDIVIHMDAETLIVDAKYKDIDAWPSTGDVHKLLAHAAAYQAKKAALVYPSADTYTSIRLGPSKTGCEVWVCHVPVKQLTNGVARVLEEMGLPSLGAHTAAA